MKTVEDDAATQQAFLYNSCQVKISNVIFDEPVCPGRFCDNVHCYYGGKKTSLCSCFENTVAEAQTIALGGQLLVGFAGEHMMINQLLMCPQEEIKSRHYQEKSSTM